MKRMTIQDLKSGLSKAVAEAEAGTTILITRHAEAVAQLGPARPGSVHRASLAAMRPLRPALKRATRGRYLAVLREDRGEP
jgi:antitoxin (DNA-binding transcriptional repressor) of toxin-antitoxin stability system